MHDLISNIAVEQVLKPQSIQASALNSGTIDCQGVEDLTVVAMVGDIADSLSGSVRIDIKIEHADDNNGTPGSFTACTDMDVSNYAGLSSGIFASIDASGKKNKRYAIGYRGGKRFVKVTATPVSLSSGGVVAMLALKAGLAQKPAANA